MTLINSSIPNLINGVSQQPYNLRLASQCELQENCYPSTVDSLTRRAPSQHIKKFTSSPLDSAYLHTINRDTIERYQVVVSNGAIAVYDISGNPRTVNMPDGASYLAASDPKTQFRAITVADYTFIVNQTITTAMTNALTASRNPEALIWIKQALPGKTYRVYVNNAVMATYTVPDSPSTSVDTANILNNLRDQLTTNLGASYTVTGYSPSVIHFIRNTNTDFSVTTEDGFGGNALSVTKGTVQLFAQLPPIAPSGFYAKIVGNADSDVDDYWVKYNTSTGAANASGVWIETVGPGLTYQLDPLKMPFVLVRNADATFTFKKATWVDRKAGDDITNPNPSFIGKTITDIFFYKNRLGLLAGEGCIMSGSGDFFRFYRASATQQTDDDPIDVAATHVKVSLLKFAIPYNEKLLLFSDQTQFILQGKDILSPKTVSIAPTTEFVLAPKCKPIGVGKNVYFCSPAGSWSSILEYFTDNQSIVNDASDVTSHVPHYIPYDIFKIAAAVNEGCLALVASSTPNVIYSYKFYWQGEQKVQSAWSKWIFGETDIILSAEFIESVLYLVIQRPDGCYMEKIDISGKNTDPNSTFITYLDRRITEAAFTSRTYNSGANLTTFVLPYPVTIQSQYRAAVRATNTNLNLPEGTLLQPTWLDASTFTINGDHTATKFYFGRRYSSRYKISPLLIRKAQGQATVAVLDGRTQLRNIVTDYNATGYFEVRVTP